MAFETVDWALDQADLKPVTKLVLAVLAKFRNAQTGECHPSQKTLARACGVSVSAINRHLRVLEGRGLIRRTRRFNRKTGASYSTQYSFPRLGRAPRDGFET